MSLPIREALKYSSPSELISTTLKQAKFIQKHLNAFTTFESEGNLEKISKEADIRHDKGKLLSHLDGIPFGIKDNFCTKDLRTTCCSKILEPFIPKYDATVVSKTRNAGGIILGKVKLFKFLYNFFPKYYFFICNFMDFLKCYQLFQKFGLLFRPIWMNLEWAQVA